MHYEIDVYDIQVGPI